MPHATPSEQLVAYLTDVHSTEENALAQLKTGAETAGHPGLTAAFREHLAETEEHERLLRGRARGPRRGPLEAEGPRAEGQRHGYRRAGQERP